MEREKASPDEIRTLYEKAISEPGVAEVMQVYQRTAQLQKAMAPYASLMQPRTIVSSATGSCVVQTADRS